MRQPIAINQPEPSVLAMLRTEQRANPAGLYQMILELAGLGVAESWSDSLSIGRDPEIRWGRANGWYLYAGAESEQIAHRRHSRPGDAVRAIGARVLTAEIAQDETNRPEAYADDGSQPVNDRDIIWL